VFGRDTHSRNEFANKQKPSTIEMFVWVPGIEIIVKHFPLPEGINSEFLQELEKRTGIYTAALGREILASSAAAPVTTGHGICVEI
jgi:cyanate permease